MRPTETSAAVLAPPSRAPVIRPGQTAVNGIGWQVEVLTPLGWQPVLGLDWMQTEAQAAGWADACHFARPDLEFRAYERLEVA